MSFTGVCKLSWEADTWHALPLSSGEFLASLFYYFFIYYIIYIPPLGSRLLDCVYTPAIFPGLNHLVLVEGQFGVHPHTPHTHSTNLLDLPHVPTSQPHYINIYIINGFPAKSCHYKLYP